MNKRFSEEQIIGFLREADRGMAVNELCRKCSFFSPGTAGLATVPGTTKHRALGAIDRE